ncbi:hypothetical protein, partial [Arthrobacter bambusae]
MLILSIFAAFTALARSVESPRSVIFAKAVPGVQDAAPIGERAFGADSSGGCNASFMLLILPVFVRGLARVFSSRG